MKHKSIIISEKWYYTISQYFNNAKMKIFLLVIVALFNLTQTSFAALSFNIKNEDLQKTKILFFGFDQTDPNLKKDANDVLERVKKNLRTTDLFEVIKNSGQLEEKNQKSSATKNNSTTISVENVPDFALYNKSGIGAIIVAQFNYDDQGNLEMRVRLWDALDQRQLFGKLYSASRQNYRKMAALFSDEIFKAITGEKKGHFNSRIAYVSESGEIRHRIKRIATVDFDGENKHFLTDGKDLVLTPIFSKNSDEIFYLRYFNNRPQIFSINTKLLRSKHVGGFQGTSFAASTHPKDPNLILLSAIFEGNSDIFELNISENTARRLTKSPAIDTTASYSPDAKLIAFISDRDSSQQIYIMSNNGTDVRKLSAGTGSYSKPVWSPDGTMLAFTRIKGGQFYIGTMSANGTNERLLTSAYIVEGAKWSPNGRYLIYSKKNGPYGEASVPHLYIIDITTGFEFKLPTGDLEGASDPDWIEITN